MAGGMPSVLAGRRARLWRRTRLGLLLTGIGLLVAWIPLVSALAAIFLALGSTFLFLGARAAGRRHEVAVLLAYVALTVGGVVIGIFVATFLLRAYHAPRFGVPLSDLRPEASLLVWGTLPGTLATVAGFALQVIVLTPSRQRRALYLASVGLAASAVLATILSASELDRMTAPAITFASVFDFLTRLSLYRMVEGPPYVAFAVLYLLAYWDAGFPTPPPTRPVPMPRAAEKG